MAPIVKDFGMDPQHRKYVFADEYTATSEHSLREPYNKEDREQGIRRRPSAARNRFADERRKLGTYDFFFIAFVYSTSTHLHIMICNIKFFHR